MTIPDTFAWTSPFGNSALLLSYYHAHSRNLYDGKVKTEAQFKELLQTNEQRPELMLMHNFIVDRAAIVGLCRAHGINVVHAEDGFFPHYGTVHHDPLGFCWESSLPRMVFRQCSDAQRQRAQTLRNAWLQKTAGELPAQVKKPFVLWPLQLPGDKVNKWDLRLAKWDGLLRHFRAHLPSEFQLVIKPHPRSAQEPDPELSALTRELDNTILLPHGVSLPALLAECQGAAGANSSALYEARLIHQKPTYTYARSWYTNHDELFPVLRQRILRPLPQIEFLEDPRRLRTERLLDYTDWFLAQLLARQFDEPFTSYPRLFKQKALRLGYQSFLMHGESIFDE